VALAAACNPKTRRTPDDTLVFVLEQEVRELDPRYVVTNHETKISRLCAPALVSVDQPSLEPRLELAEKVERIDPVTWDVTVRADARFPDGSPVTARDVVYTFETTLHDVRSQAHHLFDERLAGVEALGERTARFHLKQQLATFVTDLEYGIVSAAAAEAGGGHFAGGGVVGAGPYQVASMRPDELVLERNPRYHGPRPAMARLVFRTIADANARLLVLVGGSADASLNSVRLDLLPRLEGRERVRIETGPSALLTYLLLNNDDPLLADVRVRQAIALAIDREAIIRGRLGGRARLATGLIPPGHWAYSADVPTYPHDPARARALLDAAGHPVGPDGRRFSLVYKTSSDLARIAVARLIAQDLAEVGIDVEVRSFEFATVFADLKRGNYQLASLQTGSVAEPDMYVTYFHSSRIPAPDRPDLANRSHYRSAEADRLMEAGRHELDHDARVRIYADLQRLLATDLPVIPLWHEDNVAVLNRDVQGFVVLPNAYLSPLAQVTKTRSD
jgi:peptide/nickel transport system substrate-binding protein